MGSKYQKEKWENTSLLATCLHKPVKTRSIAWVASNTLRAPKSVYIYWNGVHWLAARLIQQSNTRRRTDYAVHVGHASSDIISCLRESQQYWVAIRAGPESTLLHNCTDEGVDGILMTAQDRLPGKVFSLSWASTHKLLGDNAAEMYALSSSMI